MERKRLIRPVTVLKYKQYMTEVFKKVLAGETFSVDKLARKHLLSGSVGTALIKYGWIIQTDVKFQFRLSSGIQIDIPVSDMDAKKLIEQVRLMNDKGKNEQGTMNAEITTSGSHEVKVNIKDDDLSGIKLKQREGAEIGSMLKKALQQSNNIPSLFDESRKEREELVQIASSIAGGIFGDLGLDISSFHKISDERIQELNERIVFAATDLHKKLIFTNIKHYSETV